MKKTDIALIILISAISVLLSFWIFSLILEDPTEKFVRVEYVSGITSTLDAPDIEVFNSNAENPTVDVIIGKCSKTEVWDEATQRCKPRGTDNPVPETPDTPETPVTPDTPENPDTPVTPDTPDTPDNPEF